MNKQTRLPIPATHRTRAQPTALTLAQSWWLFAAAAAALLPLAPHLPIWLTSAAAVGMIWRAALIWRAGRLPPRWLLVVLVIAGCLAVGLYYRTVFGRNPGLALLVLFLSMKLLELRSVRDGLTIVLLSCFLLLAGFFFSQSIASALIALLSLTLIIGAQLSLHSPSQRPPQALRQAGLMLAQALPFMLVLFVLFPRVQGPLWGLPLDAFTATSGLTDNMSPGSFSQLAQSDAIAFRVRFKDPVPANAQLYWRGIVLSQYDGRTWRRTIEPENGRLAIPDLNTERRDAAPPANLLATDYEVTLEPHNQRWLFALEQMGRLPPDSNLSADHLLLAQQAVRTRQRYAMTSYLGASSPLEESPRVLRNALQLPAGSNPRTRSVAASWQQAATQVDSTQAQDATILNLALQFFQKQLLQYTLSPPLMGDNSVDEFLFDYKRGFCEHFASAFVFALRAAGVPARVVGGYQGGEVNPVDSFFIVRQSDAHAWAEVWLNNRGWVRVDPTAESAPTRISEGLLNAVPNTDTLPLMARAEFSWLRELRYRWDAAANTWNQAVLGFNPQRQRELLAGLGMPSPDWQQMTAWLAILCGSLLALMTGVALYQRQRIDELTRLWQLFQRRLIKAGVSIPPWAGPETIAIAASGKLPSHSNLIHTIATCYSALRYASPSNETAVLLVQLKGHLKHFRP